MQAVLADVFNAGTFIYPATCIYILKSLNILFECFGFFFVAQLTGRLLAFLVILYRRCQEPASEP